MLSVVRSRLSPLRRAKTLAPVKLLSSQPQISLWHSVDARSLRCLWSLEELGITDYQLTTMPFPPRVFHKEFLKTNMLGTIPYFTDGDQVMTESCGICQYLVSKYGPSPLAVRADEPEYAQYLNWLHHADATLTFPQTVVLRYSLLEPGKCDIAAADYAKWYLARLRLLDATLADGRQYLVGERFTIADICVGYALYVAQAFELKVDGNLLTERYEPQTTAYLKKLLQRPAFLSCLSIQAASLSEYHRRNKEIRATQ